MAWSDILLADTSERQKRRLVITRIKIAGYRLFAELDLFPAPGMNIVVGDNESGKSTLLEAVTLALTGRVNGRWAADEINHYWFNQDIVRRFFLDVGQGRTAAPPTISIEVFLRNDVDSMQPLRGAHNSTQETVPGVAVHVTPSLEYADEFSAYLADPNSPSILPVEYYSIEWRDFAGEKLVRRPKVLSLTRIDSRTAAGSASVKGFTRELLAEHLDPKDRAMTSVAYRNSVDQITTEPLNSVNLNVSQGAVGLHDETIKLQMDQSANASWEEGVVPHVANVPFSMAGQGQQVAVKLALALNRSPDGATCVLVEEPENHLSFTSLSRLVSRIERQAGDRQTFVTTHSSFVANRLGLGSLRLLSKGGLAEIEQLPISTIQYFKKLPGYDTLRIVLARRIVLVEGPSDEIIFERAFRDIVGVNPMERGIDVLSMGGTALARSLALCAALGRQATALRDNDGEHPSHWIGRLEQYIEPGLRDVFIGLPEDGTTLESQICARNSKEQLRTLLKYNGELTILDWMLANKTTAAIRIAESESSIEYPRYIRDAIDSLR